MTLLRKRETCIPLVFAISPRLIFPRKMQAKGSSSGDSIIIDRAAGKGGKHTVPSPASKNQSKADAVNSDVTFLHAENV